MSRCFILPVLVFVLAFWSCTEEDAHRPNPNCPVSVETSGKRNLISSFNSPEELPLGKPLVIGNSEKITTPASNNVFPVNGAPVVIDVPEPGPADIHTPGKDSFLLPVTQPLKTKVTLAGIPETVAAKDADSKDDNSANFSFYKVLQGLKQSNIRCLYQDSKGMLWLGTYAGGASRYDGRSFTHFTEEQGLHNSIRCITEDSKGNIWFGTGDGAVCYNGRSFTRYPYPEVGAVTSIFEDSKGNTWLGSETGVCCISSNTMTIFNKQTGFTSLRVNSILEDADGMIWFATLEGAFTYDGTSFRQYTTAHGLNNNEILSMITDANGGMWFGTANGATYLNEGKFTQYRKSSGLIGDYISSLCCDRNGNTWFGSYYNGISKFDPVANTFTGYSEAQGMSNNTVMAIVQDKNGTLWFGTSSGLNRYNGESFTTYTQAQGLSNSVVLGICEDKRGLLWLGTNLGISYYDKDRFTKFAGTEDLFRTPVYCVSEDSEENIWFGTAGQGAVKYDGASFFVYGAEQGMGADISCMEEDRAGNIWFGAGLGICLYKPREIFPESPEGTITYFTEENGFSDYGVNCMIEDSKGNLWLGTNGDGLVKYDGQSFTFFRKEDGLANNTVYCLLEDKTGVLWSGGPSGISRYDGKMITVFNESHGLSNNAVFNLFQDDADNLWIGTRKGLSKMSPGKQRQLTNMKEDFDPIESALFYNYGYNDGFIGLNCLRNSVTQDNTGKIWWGTERLTCYNPDGDIADTTAPVVNLTGIKLFGENISWGEMDAVTIDSTGKEIIKGTAHDTVLANGVLLSGIRFDGLTRWYSLPVNFSLPHNNNSLSFNYAGVHLQSRNHITYQYKLEGLDNDWSSVTDRTEVSYGNLAPGNYVFKIKAMNQSGVWSDPFEYAFEIRPPWWQTWSFRILAMLLVVGSLTGYFRWRTASLRRRQKELEQTVEERTTEIIHQKELVEVKQKEILDSIAYAKRLQEAILPSLDFVQRYFPESFVLYKPKDIVAGDFYWFEHSNGISYLAAADCTGHGVPGALVSVVCSNALNRVVLEFGITDPGEILVKTRELVLATFAKSDHEVKDGMDISLVAISPSAQGITTVRWAGANNPLWYFSANELKEIVAHKQSIGKTDNPTPFVTHTLQLQKGDCVYLFTDGYADQFGGPRGKKFKYRQMHQKVLDISSMSMREQKQELETAFELWKGDLEQVDDVCVVGVRIM